MNQLQRDWKEIEQLRMRHKTKEAMEKIRERFKRVLSRRCRRQRRTA